MKIMRYGSKYRYNQNQNSKTKIIVIAASLALIALIAVVIFRLISINRMSDDNGALSLQLRDGKPTAMNVVTGDVCILNMPGAIDMKEVEFVSSDASVVRVDSAGHADALSEGTATVTASARNFSAQCEFTVAKSAEPEQPSELTTAIKANGDILAANSARGTDDLYSITVNRRTNTVTVYTYDDKGEYTVPVRAMVASCGTGGDNITVTGDYSIYFQEPWHPLFGDVCGMFVSGFEGPYLFHSVPYESYDHDALETEEFNKLGSNASQGCVRMMVSDVYWIFKNCGLNTPVHVIDADSGRDPLGKPEAVKIPDGTKWDPTDDTEGNPFLGKLPTISGAADVQLSKGAAFDPMAGIQAADICGNDISDRVKLAGEVIGDKPGEYYLTYSVVDPFGLKTKVTRTVTVK